MRAMKLIGLTVTVGVLTLAAPPALGCTSVAVWPSKPPVSLEDRQAQMWRDADSVVLVRLAAINRLDPRLSARERRELRMADPTATGVTLEPQRWLKGRGQQDLLRVRRRGGGDCSVAAGWDASSARVGDVFVAYFTAGPLSDEALIDGLAPAAIVDPTVKALLAPTQ